jgi:hypothetical protein
MHRTNPEYIAPGKLRLLPRRPELHTNLHFRQKTNLLLSFIYKVGSSFLSSL